MILNSVVRRGYWASLALLLVLGACAPSSEPVEDLAAVETHNLARTVAAQVQMTVSAIAAEATVPAPTVSPTLPPAATLTPTPEPVYISVSAPTNCRIGPGRQYTRTGTLLIDATAQVIAKSSTSNFWYIVNPDRPDEYCWLWGEYASVTGDEQVLPIYTPPPSPTPSPAFTMSLESLWSCGDTEYLIFKIHNPTEITYRTAQLHLKDLDTGKELHGPRFERWPFALRPRECPPGHKNEIYPDRVGYIYVTYSGAVNGHNLRMIIMVCTEDYLGGDCWVQAMDFRMPGG